MIALIQRVSEAKVTIADQQPPLVAAIERGLLALIGIEQHDSENEAMRLLERLLGYRVFSDEHGKMNLSVADIQGAVLLVPQFTLVADTRKGMRPGFSRGARPEHGQKLFAFLVAQARNQHAHIACGQFAVDMQVALVNDGPVTFWLQASPSVPK